MSEGKPSYPSPYIALFPFPSLPGRVLPLLSSHRKGNTKIASPTEIFDTQMLFLFKNTEILSSTCIVPILTGSLDPGFHLNLLAIADLAIMFDL